MLIILTFYGTNFAFDDYVFQNRRDTRMLLNSLQTNLHISEPSQHTEILNDWALTYDQLSVGKFESQLREVSFEGIQIYQEKIKPSTFQRGEGLKNSLCLGLFSDLDHPALWMGKAVTGHEILSVFDGGDILLRSPENCSFYSLTVPFELLCSQHADLATSDYANLLDTQSSDQFHAAYLKIFNHILQNPYILENSTARKQLKSDVLAVTERFVQTFGHNKVTSKISTKRAKNVVLTACDMMQANNQEFQSIEELCNITHTSRRTLQNCFELITGQSPAAFMKTLRLNAVKRVLTDHSCTSKVIADVAMDWGFWHLSQFAADYKKLFGESPSQTVINHGLANKISKQCS